MKLITHFFAVAAGAVWGFFMTPAGQSLMHQYPKIGSFVAGLTTILAIYHKPNIVVE